MGDGEEKMKQFQAMASEPRLLSSTNAEGDLSKGCFCSPCVSVRHQGVQINDKPWPIHTPSHLLSVTLAHLLFLTGVQRFHSLLHSVLLEKLHETTIMLFHVEKMGLEIFFLIAFILLVLYQL